VTGRRTPGYGLLLAAAVVSVAVQGIARPGDVQLVVVTTLAAVTLLLALRTAGVRRSLIQAAAIAAAALVVISVVRAATGEIGDGTVRITTAALVAFGPPAVAVGVLRDLRASGRVGLESVMGVLSLYLLLGMLFALVYGAIDRLGGAPFFNGGGEATHSNCLYFSFITLTTVGYGDFTARSDLGHTLALFEALLGQIYLVTVVSLIVSNLGRPARRAEEPSP
jgi:hypothetical protein